MTPFSIREFSSFRILANSLTKKLNKKLFPLQLLQPTGPVIPAGTQHHKIPDNQNHQERAGFIFLLTLKQLNV